MKKILRYFHIVIPSAIIALLLTALLAYSDSGGIFQDNIVDAEKYGSLDRAYAIAIAGRYKKIVVNTTIPLKSALSVTSSIGIEVNPGGLISLGSNTLTVNGPFHAGPYTAVTGTGPVLFGSGSVKEVYPEWWGAKKDGSTDTTKAINAAVSSIAASGGTVLFSRGGEYRVSNAINLVNVSNITLSGGGTIRQLDGTKNTVLIQGGQNIAINHLKLIGTFLTSGPVGDVPMIYVYPGTAQTSSNIAIQDVDFYYNSNDAIYVGGDNSTYGATDGITIKNCKMYYGLSFLLSTGITNMTVEGITTVHRITAPPGAGVSQDEDIAVWSDNGRSSENITISNINIESGGTTTNAYTGRPKLAFGISQLGLSFYNLNVGNVNVKDNLGTFTPAYGSSGATLYISDLNADRKGFKNAQFSNLNFYNSPGIFIEANNLSFSNVTLDTMPTVSGFSGYGRAIDSAQAVSTAGTKFSNVRINSWSGTPIIYTAEGGVTFDGFSITNSPGSLWAAKNSIYSNMTFSNVGDATYGAFLMSGTTTSVTLANALFSNCSYTALRDTTANRVAGARLTNIIFSGNAVDTDVVISNQSALNIAGQNSSILATLNLTGHLIMPTGGYTIKLNGQNSGLGFIGADTTGHGASMSLYGHTVGGGFNDATTFSRSNGASTTVTMQLKGSGVVSLPSITSYANNTAALAGGLLAGDVYSSPTGTLLIVY